MDIFIKTLGCPKNEVDSEHLAEFLTKKGYTVVNNESNSSCIIINTCAFIQDAVKESLNTVIETRIKKGNKCKIFVTGCLYNRYKNELEKTLSEADGFFSLSDPKIEKIIGPPKNRDILKHDFLCYDKYVKPWTYVKIAEGCDRSCSFCVIPYIKGKFRSFNTEKILSEIKRKIINCREIVLVAQDTLFWGKEKGENLIELLKKIVRIKGDFYVRLLYLHPSSITKELCDFILKEEKMFDYFDIPVQHIVPKVLISMKRPVIDRKKIINLIERIRKVSPLAVIRTTVMTGFPTETEKDFKELEKFMKEVQFNHAGCFAYSREENTPAFCLGDTVSKKKKEERKAEIMKIQAKISEKWLSCFVGKVINATSDGYIEDGLTSFRNYYFAPEIDGRIIVSGIFTPGTRKKIKIFSSDTYDLHGEPE